MAYTRSAKKNYKSFQKNGDLRRISVDRHQEYLAECVFLFAPPEVKVAANMVRDASA